MSSSMTINHATREDVPSILSLIKALAGYENAASSVEATEESLLSSLCFAPSQGAAPEGQGYARTLLVRIPSSSGDQAVGMALYFFNYSTWTSRPGIYLEDLFVQPEHRGKGYGKALIKALAKETQRIGGRRLEWSCLKWNEPSLKFYRSLRAKEMVDWVGLRVDGEALDKLAQ